VALRDLFLFGVLAVLVFKIPRHPIVGALAWVVFGVMYPHRLSWGPAHDFPFSQIIALLTLVGLLITKDHREPKGGAAAVVLLVLLGWSAAMTLFAFHPSQAFAYLERVAKVFLMTFVLLLLLHTRKQIEALVWCLVVSIGFYGTKGGIFVLMTGGNFMVYGPPDSPMDGSNSLGVGTVIIIPLMYYLAQVSERRVVRVGLLIAIGLCAASVLGSYSRGAFLAILSMGALLWLRGRHKVLLAAAAILFVTVAIPLMPEHWADRMQTIETYEDDASAMGRIISWQTAYNVAKDRFPVGGGFEWHGPDTSAKYSPVPDVFYVAHSIYFQIMGSLGFIGLAIFLLFWWLVWRQASWLRKHCRGRPDLHWAFLLGSLTHVSLVGYFVGGAFLDLAFWDLPYYLYTALAGAQYLVRTQSADNRRAARSGSAAATLAVEYSNHGRLHDSRQT
jgi:probable O-glycosylation ligase (exosortase A-associated)